MTNITLSIKDEVYRRMKHHSEIKWSEFVRKMIEQRLDSLEKLEGVSEGVATMLTSEHVLKKEWENEKDERWNEV